ncbi:hypothetical protein AQPE_1263 [Aquipluma nitroreducens]|uniref:Uncharacterized protein n=1 Tax=Aquipluma nitroreducens TaxID=2010828 RepID=A0A5K7S721_9BACT|nr:hypothetical protein [Aquipluma nitroreducens]BBE17114.1 hypothetical protein AQPE_1263 [Aquipluma nitroreducens]
MPLLVKNTKGLKPQHQAEAPLFEKTYVPPSFGNHLVSRVYADGSLYYLSHSGESSCLNDADEKWNYISSVSEKGVLGIRVILEKCRNLPIAASTSANASGAVIWKIPLEGRIQKIEVFGVPEGDLKIFNEIDLLVNTNIQTIPRG